MTMIKDNRDGFALMLVIWILAIFMVVALSFSYSTKVETEATRTFKENVEEKFMAEGGIERAIVELMIRKTNPGIADPEALNWRPDGTENRLDYDHGFCLVSITFENGKLDINKAPEVLIRNLLLALGIKGEDADIIVDSMQDWRDGDNLHRLNGAEDDYYQSLPVPYKAKNGDFESAEELLLVRGVTSEIMYGTKESPGIARFLTVRSESGKINVSSAPREVLLALPGMTPEMADAVVEFRKNAEIKSVQDFAGIVGALYGPMSQYVSAGDSSVFSIEAVGKRRTEKPGYGVKAVVGISGTKPVYLQYRSPWETGTWKKQETSPRS